MDLTRLYNLTTPELRREAELVGVADTAALSRAQLIQAIRVRVGAENPEGFLGKMLGFAKWAIQTTAPVDEPKHFPRPSEPPRRAANAAPDAPHSNAPTGVFSMPAPASSREEPFPTRTMARILADQGHYKRSLAIYSTLLEGEPQNPDLQQEAEAVRARSRSRRPHAR